jgi:hypothetical protein
MLYKTSRFHGGNYEECRLLGYKTPVHTSQGAYYVTGTVSSRLILCKIWYFHGGNNEECRILGCDSGFVLLVRTITFGEAATGQLSPR